MKLEKIIDTTSDNYYLNPYKCISYNQNHNQIKNNNYTTYNCKNNKNLNLIVETLESIITSNNKLSNDELSNDDSISKNKKVKFEKKSNSIDKYIIFKHIANNDMNQLKKILSENINDINIQDIDGDTALHIAIFLSNYNACKILINFGANMLIKDKWGQIPLHRICFTLKDKNTIKIIDLLLKFNQKKIFNYVDKYNNTPLHLVIKYILKNNMCINKNIQLIVHKLIELTNIDLMNDDNLSIRDLLNMLNLTP